MSGLGSDELDPQESQEKGKKKRQKRFQSNKKSAKPKPKPKAKPKKQSPNKQKTLTLQTWMDMEEKTPDAENVPQTSKETKGTGKNKCTNT